MIDRIVDSVKAEQEQWYWSAVHFLIVSDLCKLSKVHHEETEE